VCFLLGLIFEKESLAGINLVRLVKFNLDWVAWVGEIGFGI